MYKITLSNGIVRLLDGAFIPSDPANSDYAEYLAWVAKGNKPRQDVDRQEVPQSVTPLQASRALLQAGYLDEVEAAIAISDRETQLAWEKATAVERNSPFVAKLAAAIGLTDDQVNQLFIAAAKL